MRLPLKALRYALIGVSATLSLTVGAFSSAVAQANNNLNLPAQSAWMHADFLASLGAPTHTATLCLIDTGVDLNPGTEAALITREAVDGGSADDNVGHGTMLTQSIASSGFGFSGLWPQVRIISERVTDESGNVYTNLVVAAIDRCTALGASVINMSLAGADISGQEQDFADAIANAQAHDIVLVAAAGNDNGGAVQYPAALPGVLAVGGSNASGAYCGISAQGAPIALVAPGCGLDISAPDGSPEGGVGTSFSSVYVATIATALRAYSGMSAADTIATLTNSADTVASGHEVDAAAAFRLAGLSALITTPSSPAPTPIPTTPSATTPVSTTPVGTTVSPRSRSTTKPNTSSGRVSARWTTSGILISAAPPSGLHLLVRVHGLSASANANARTLLLRVTRAPYIFVAFANASNAHSRFVRVRVR
jgi:hypothetical protein